MGWDLKVYVIEEHNINDDSWYFFNQLAFKRDYRLFQFIEDRFHSEYETVFNKPLPLPVDKFTHCTYDYCAEFTLDDEDEHLNYVLAGEFRKLTNMDFGEWNNAIVAFLARAPKHLPVVLRFTY